MDNKKQEKLGEFISKEVFACQTFLVNEMLNKGEICRYEDIINYYADLDEEVDEAIKEIMADNADISEEEAEKQAVDDLKDEQLPQEIMEWWLVSEWLERKLEAKGQPILKTDYGNWWGRCGTGQAILLDGVIEEIFDEVK